NPGRTPAVVTLRAWGAGGEIDEVGAGSMLVPPGGERALLVEGLAAEQPRLVLHVQASGGLVTAWLQESVLHGLVPGGVDQVGPGDGPDTVQAVPGLVLRDVDLEETEPAVLRLLAPEEGGTVTVLLLGPDGAVRLPSAP